jgi:hypothetical protein
MVQRFLDANDGNVFFAAAAAGVGLAAYDPTNPLRLPYSPRNAALFAAEMFDISDEKTIKGIERAIEIALEQDPGLRKP